MDRQRFFFLEQMIMGATSCRACSTEGRFLCSLDCSRPLCRWGWGSSWEVLQDILASGLTMPSCVAPKSSLPCHGSTCCLRCVPFCLCTSVPGSRSFFLLVSWGSRDGRVLRGWFAASF